MKLLITLVASLCLFSQALFADEVSDLQGLGSNQELIKRAQKMDPKSRYRIVQKRLVDRNKRFEFSAGGNIVAGGDAYFDTANLGVQADFHINPNWSVGARYYKSNNTLTKEGQRVHDIADSTPSNQTATVPDLDPPSQTVFGTLTFYPVYGKLNFFNVKTVQFDVYTVLGAGAIELIDSGQTFAYTAGLGTGIWFNNRITARVEVRYQGYQDSLNSVDGPRQMNTVNAGITLGFLL